MKRTKEGTKMRIETFQVILKRKGSDPKIREYCERAIRSLKNQEEA